MGAFLISIITTDMRLSHFILSLLTVVMLSCGGKTDSKDIKTIKVMAWNIWHGGHSEKYPQTGCNGVLDLIEATNPDVILMIETYGASNRVADRLGYFHRLLSSNLSIYSRYPITETITFPKSIDTFNFGGVEIDVDGQRVRVFDTWLHYLPDATEVPEGLKEADLIAWELSGSRNEELQSILQSISNYIAEADSIPLIVGGDFNSHSHLDWVEQTKDIYNHNGAVVNWPISMMMIDAGFKDSYREYNPNVVDNIGATWIYPLEGNRADRIDYIYYKGSSLLVDNSIIYNGKLGENIVIDGDEYFYSSDHGFVLTTFTINANK